MVVVAGCKPAQIWDVEGGELLATMQAGVGNALYCLSVSPDKLGVVVGSRHCQVQMFDLERAAQVRSLVGHSKEVYSVHSSDSCIVSGSGDSTIKVWDTRAYECAATFAGHAATVMCLRYDGDHRILSGSYDRTVKVSPSVPETWLPKQVAVVICVCVRLADLGHAFHQRTSDDACVPRRSTVLPGGKLNVKSCADCSFHAQN